MNLNGKMPDRRLQRSNEVNQQDLNGSMNFLLSKSQKKVYLNIVEIGTAPIIPSIIPANNRLFLKYAFYFNMFFIVQIVYIVINGYRRSKYSFKNSFTVNKKLKKYVHIHFSLRFLLLKVNCDRTLCD